MSVIDEIFKLIALALLLVGFGFLFVPMGWQVFEYLRSGIWTPVTIFDVVFYFSPEAAYAIYPSNWVGLARVISMVNGGFLSSLAFFFASATIFGALED